MSQTERQETVEVEPNARYDAIYGTNYSGEDPDSDRMDELREETQAEADALRDYEEEMEEVSRRPDPGDAPTVSWDDLGVTSKPAELRGICRYLSGVEPDEEDEEIRRKVRTGEVEWYLNALLVVRGVEDTEEDYV